MCISLAISVFGQFVCTAMFLFPRAKLYKITETTKIIMVKIYVILRKFKENVWWFNCK